ncbi:hypothetical protein [Pectobacterium aquaticum]|uniref:hypothetical protein n=1 Tax=Pectobacterium aquaticum TaxID=2204145 RepID=UPI000E27AEC4|nr:hypothetical protein [Pectobacterium aquaticum]RRN94345.1 hypothetical protein DMB79_016315 [Pectobacterium aquaticum]RRO03423.1 hypothetical protein DMB83_006345 [Pectobacterium aquaticum]UEM38039.1 hypothetical protein DMB82_0012645 [Pectobacterium aquaticum]
MSDAKTMSTVKTMSNLKTMSNVKTMSTVKNAALQRPQLSLPNNADKLLLHDWDYNWRKRFTLLFRYSRFRSTNKFISGLSPAHGIGLSASYFFTST